MPATNDGSVVSETACVAGKLEMLAVTLPICDVPAGREKLTYTGIAVSLAAKALKPSNIELVVTFAVTVPEMGRGVAFVPSILLESSFMCIETHLVAEFSSNNSISSSGNTAFAVTVPEIAGREPIVTELPTVTEEMLTGTVPEMLAVTLPICAVPATNDGSEARETGWVAGKFPMETAENVTACEAGKFKTDTLPVTAPKVVVCDAGKFEMVMAVLCS